MKTEDHSRNILTPSHNRLHNKKTIYFKKVLGNIDTPATRNTTGRNNKLN